MSDSFCAFETVEESLCVDGLKKYLKTYHAEDLTYILESDQPEAHFSINVNSLDLLQASNRIGSLVLAYPSMMIPWFDKAAHEALDEIIKEQRSMLLTYKKYVHVRIYSLPLCQETSKASVSSIRSSDINKFVSVSGTVIKTGPIKMLEYEKMFQCTKCRKNFVVKADIEQHYTMHKPTTCIASEDCAGKYFKPVEGSQVCRDYQEIKIQDKIAHLNVGSIPRSILVILEDDLVDLCKAGDDVLITGTVMRRWRPLKPDARSTIEMIVHCNHIRINNEQKSNINVTQEMENEFKEFWKNHRNSPLKARNLILKSMCPQLYGLYFVKLAVALTLIGGVPMLKSGTRIRGESHLLIVGDPGTGKSQFLKYASRLSPRYVMTNGIGTTSAGLTVMATKESGGDWTLEAGALVLADGGVCCIDEFDAIREHDRTTIHEAMEQQTLSIAKAGLVCKLNTRTTIFAACNPKGKYDLTASLSINCALASPLLSRFDIVLVLLDQKDDDWDKQVSRFILDEAQVLPDETDDHLWSIEKMQAYISYVKGTFKPTIPTAAGQILNRYYLLQRDRDQRVAARTTIRLLESLVRLAQAHARLMFRTAVTEQDAIMAVLSVDTSMHTSTIINIESVLHSNFPDDPDAEYELHRVQVLTALGLMENHQKSLTQRPLLSQRLPQNNMVDDDDDKNEEEEDNLFEENFALEPPAKKQRIEESPARKVSKSTQRIANRMTIPDLDMDEDSNQPEDDYDFGNFRKQQQNVPTKRSVTQSVRYAPEVEAIPSQREPSQEQLFDDDLPEPELEELPEPTPPPKPSQRPIRSQQPAQTTPRTPSLQLKKPTSSFVTPAPPSTRNKVQDNSTLKVLNDSRNDIDDSAAKKPPKPKKRSLAHLLMDSQPEQQQEEVIEMNPDEEVDMIFGSMFDGNEDLNLSSQGGEPTVTVRKGRYI